MGGPVRRSQPTNQQQQSRGNAKGGSYSGRVGDGAEAEDTPVEGGGDDGFALLLEVLGVLAHKLRDGHAAEFHQTEISRQNRGVLHFAGNPQPSNGLELFGEREGAVKVLGIVQNCLGQGMLRPQLGGGQNAKELPFIFRTKPAG
jgi:hypothetical protein